MKFIALVSGGKDSCFNIMHCLNAGHELVGMANLRPKESRPNEIDSWMYQTVGHQAVECVARCARVPLFRAEISEDEDAVVTELVQLLDCIRGSGLTFEGVSVGAIGSTYQQVRVDKACAAAGVRSLSYLWQRGQAELLREIVASGLDARIIKVAGMGLKREHLGKSLGALEEELLSLHRKFGLHPCGEGGEYETMVFDAPFFKSQRLAIKPASERTVHHSTDDVYYLDFEVQLEDKPHPPGPVSVAIPPLLDTRFSTLLTHDVLRPLDNIDEPALAKPAPKELEPKHAQRTFAGSFTEVFDTIKRFLVFDTSLERCYHVNAVIRDMARFAEMNALYIDVFEEAGAPLARVPPSRACIEAAISCDLEITIWHMASPDPSQKGLHVQGLSYWAPASIGPYSQCRFVHGISYTAGQIGLIPQSLALEGDLQTEALLSLQNAVRILDVMHESSVNWEPVVAVVYITDENNQSLCQQIWARFSALPLVTAVVDRLPRGARFEWWVQASDLRYFSWYVPDNDDDEQFYSPSPEMLYNNFNGYIRRVGFQKRRVFTNKPTRDAHLVFASTQDVSHVGHWVPTKAVYYDGLKAESVYIGC